MRPAACGCGAMLTVHRGLWRLVIGAGERRRAEWGCDREDGTVRGAAEKSGVQERGVKMEAGGG